MAGFKQRLITKKLEQELSIKNGIVTIDETSCDGCGEIGRASCRERV